MTSNKFVLAISGSTCSGKTTLAKMLHKLLKLELPMISQDSFWCGIENVPLKKTKRGIYKNCECPENVLWKPFYERIYDYKFKKKSNDPLVLVEGFLLFEEPKVTQLYDRALYIETPLDVAWKRRVQRNIDIPTDYFFEKDLVGKKEWLREYWEEIVIPESQKYVGHKKFKNCQIIDGSTTPEVTLKHALRTLIMNKGLEKK
ncbi:hypothetical protein M0813_14148 [Anaeramoeba flamelloides]|uniref:Phosphoribulokinase/uridine kinase domain-containing protein n=1 Tax=Anaeramoeba flamelloides TaxID=1746091 RepID=A0ABQ8Z6F1_9EUKA|nr:hypothetical protein M0813_14148 [Anaeramoeba flamelloides]